jgi:RecA-family ATPase
VTLQIALAVASGGYVLGEPVEQGPVLCLFLEDPPRRLKERMVKQSWTSDLPADFMCLGEFEKQIGDFCNGGGERLARQIELKGYRFVGIDTLSRAVSGDQIDVEAMTLALTPIQEMAHAHNCVVMLVDHHPKVTKADPDAIADILGSTAKGAVADTVWGLYKESGKVNAKVVIIGRDVEEQILALSWDGELGCWQCEGDVYKRKLTERDQEILDVLEDLGKAQVGEIAKAADQDRGNTHRRLQKLVNDKWVVRTEEENDSVYYTLHTNDD